MRTLVEQTEREIAKWLANLWNKADELGLSGDAKEEKDAAYQVAISAFGAFVDKLSRRHSLPAGCPSLYEPVRATIR